MKIKIQFFTHWDRIPDPGVCESAEIVGCMPVFEGVFLRKGYVALNYSLRGSEKFSVYLIYCKVSQSSSFYPIGQANAQWKSRINGVFLSFLPPMDHMSHLPSSSSYHLHLGNVYFKN